MATGNKIQASTDFFDTTQLRNAHPKHRSIRINSDGLSFSILDLEKSLYLGIREYTFNPIDKPLELKKKISDIIESDHLLTDPFQSTSYSIEFGNNTLVPHAFQSDKTDRELLDFLQPTLKSEQLGNDLIRAVEAHNLYPIPEIEMPSLNGSARFHSTTVFIDGMLRKWQSDKQTRMLLEVGSTHFNLMVLSDRKLIFFNRFEFRSKEDFIYFILFSMEQLQLNPEDTPLTLYGELDKRSSLFEIAYKYIRFVDFGLRPDGFQYASVLDELPNHHYYSLFQQYLCVS